jgi:hypothetical protein
MSKYRLKKKLEEGQGKSYIVRLNVGDTCMAPPRNVKHWTMSFDERGAYWTRIVKESNRNEAVYWVLRWFSNLTHRIKKRPKSTFHRLSCHPDEILEVSDDYNEVVYYPSMKPSEARNRLLPPDKLDEIIKLGKGKFKKTSDFSKKGCFTQTREYKNEKHRVRMIKVPYVPYVYKNSNTGKYHANIRIQPRVTEGGGAKFLGCERGEGGAYTTVFWKHKRGEVVQRPKAKWFALKNHVLTKAVAEAITISRRYEKRKTGYKASDF